MADKIKQWGEALSINALDKIVPAIILLVVGILIIRIVMVIVRKTLQASKLEKAAHSLIKSLVRVVLWLLLGLIVADCMGIDVTSIIALTSVLTLAVSLALQNAVSNIIGGFSLLYTRPFQSGHFVEIAGKSGVVTEIGMTYTKLTTADNKTVSIPNSAVVAGDIINYTVLGTRRVDVSICAAHNIPGQKVIDALLQAATVDKVLLDPVPTANIARFEEGAVVYTLMVWTKCEDYWEVLFTINKNIKNIFDAQEIKATYPHMHVIMQPEKEE